MLESKGPNQLICLEWKIPLLSPIDYRGKSLKKKKSEMRMNVEMSDQHFNRNISNLQPKIAKYI